ncbi:hypothetical protein NC651_000489 [Populus alba x Populus x berolinensis]|nr:hypothetical protein NC651_000489 [Populus alba x Populus x berolinensis]
MSGMDHSGGSRSNSLDTFTCEWALLLSPEKDPARYGPNKWVHVRAAMNYHA